MSIGPSLSTNQLVAFVLIAVLITSSGCVGMNPSTDSPTPTPTPTVEPTETVPTPTPIPTVEPTETVYDLPYDLRIRNYGNETTKMEITMRYNRTGDEVFREETTLEPDEQADYNISFEGAGNYTVTATTGDASDEYVWHVESSPPSHELIATADGREIRFVRSAA